MSRVFSVLFCACGVLLGLGLVQNASAEDCEAKLAGLLDDKVVASFAAQQEVHSLLELVDPDPAKNLAVLHPSIVMNAYQRVNSWIEFIPSVEIPDPLYGASTVTLWPVFSGGEEISGGKMIVGQYDVINDGFVGYVKAGARGDGAAVKMPLFSGPSGTGKSEFLTILASVATNLTSNYSDYYLMTFRFVGLKDIPELRPFLQIPVDSQGNEIDVPREDALKRSPFVLLPSDVQDRVLALARDRAIQFGKVEPTPVRIPDPQSAKIRDLILAHYAKKMGKKDLSNREIVEILSKHVEVIRRRYDGAHSFPKMGAQGKDVPYGEIFFAENPYVLTERGPGEPFAYHLNGKVLQGDGGLLLLDEWFRNPSELRDTYLDVIEDRELQRGGSPSINLDMVIVGAANDESIDDAKAKGTAKAHVDRIRRNPMRLSIHPWEISRTLLLMKGEKTLLMKKLAEGAASDVKSPQDAEAERSNWENGKLRALYPIPSSGGGYVSPEGRYALSIRMEPNDPAVFVSPHTMQFMAYTIAATRLVTEAKNVKDLGQFGVLKSHVFSDYISRLKVLTRQLDVQVDEREELRELSLLLQEGTLGISNRDAAHAWLTQAIAEARKPENDNTLTPTIVLQVFERLLQEGGITFPDHAKRLDWLRKIVGIGKAFVVPWIESDIMAAMNSGRDSINEIYDQIKHELLAQSEDRNATRYVMPGRKPREINLARLNAVKAHYYRLRGRNLEPGEVMNFHVRYGRESKERHEGLLDAINRMLAEKNAELISWDALADYGRTKKGDAEVATKYAQLANFMIHSLGYNERSLQMALEFKQQLEKAKIKGSEE